MFAFQDFGADIWPTHGSAKSCVGDAPRGAELPRCGRQMSGNDKLRVAGRGWRTPENTATATPCLRFAAAAERILRLPSDANYCMVQKQAL